MLFIPSPADCPLLSRALDAANAKGFADGLPLEAQLVAEIVKLRRICADAVGAVRVTAEMAIGERPYREEDIREAVEMVNTIEADWFADFISPFREPEGALFADGVAA